MFQVRNMINVMFLEDFSIAICSIIVILLCVVVYVSKICGSTNKVNGAIKQNNKMVTSKAGVMSWLVCEVFSRTSLRPVYFVFSIMHFEYL